MIDIRPRGIGSLLEKYLEYNKISQSDFANMLGITQKHMNEIINGKTKISTELMLGISLLTDIDVNLIAFAEQRKEMYDYLHTNIGDHKEINEFLNSYHIKEMIKNNWIKVRDIDDQSTSAIDLLNFLKVKSFDIESNYIDNKILYKKLDNANNRKILLWLRRCDNLCNGVEVPKYDSSKLKDLFKELEIIRTKEFNKDTLIELFKKYGMILVIENPLKGTKIRGCSMVKVKTPAIYMTTYFKTLDSFYFTLYHELGHIKSDYNKLISKVEVEDTDEEKEDNFALDKMIPNDIWNEIISYNKIDEELINNICEKNNIPKCFVYGRLAKLNYISFSSELYSKYKKTIEL